MFDITICHPSSPARIRDGMDNAIGLLKKARDEKIRRFRRVLHGSVASVKLFPIPLSSLGEWHPDSHRAMGSLAVDIASRALSSVHCTPSTMFKRHAALLVASSAACFNSGFDLKI